MSVALVLGVETQIGLGLVRELGRANVRVVALSHDPHSIGIASRHAWRRVIVGAPRSAELIDTINGLARELGPVSLLTVSEANLAWLNTVRDRLDAHVHLSVPPADALERVLDKSLTLDAARAAGIDVPFTLTIDTMAEWSRQAATLRYPVVLKWSHVNDVAPRLQQLGLPLLKAEYVYDASQLLAVGRRYEPVGQWPLIQEYCPGHGLGLFFFIDGGQVVRTFTHRRVAEWPPEGGFSAVCDGVPAELHGPLREKSVALLRALGWQGVAMVEYRHDPATGRSVLMEINGRFWGSFPLAVASGAGFARFAHAAALGEPLPALPPPRTDLRCRIVAAEVKRLLRLWLQPGLIADRTFSRRPVAETWRFIADFVRPRVRYFVWSLDDPLPLWRDLTNGLFRRS